MEQYSHLSPKEKKIFHNIVNSQLNDILANFQSTTVKEFIENSWNAYNNRNTKKSEHKKEKEAKSKEQKSKSIGNSFLTPEEQKFEKYMKLQLQERKEEFSSMSPRDRVKLLTHEWCTLTDEEKKAVASKNGTFIK